MIAMANKTNIFPSCLFIFGIYIAFIVIVNVVFTKDQITMFLIGTTLFASNFILMGISYFLIKRKRETIRKSFNFYIENLVSTAGVGLIAFNETGDII